MKKLLLLLLIWIYPLFSFGAINEYLTDVYYANGMQVNEGNATASTILLEDSIIEDRYNFDFREYKKHIGKVKEAYNSTHGLFPDLFESFMQKLNLQLLIDWYALLKEYVTSHLENSRDQINAYKSSIMNGHKVLVVAHSQGNLFTGEAYLALGKESKNGWMQKYFEAVSIASPRTKNIKDGTERIDWDNDPVARIATLGTRVSWMTDNPTRVIAWEDRHPGVQVDEPKQHYVNKSYLNRLYGHRWKAVENGLDFSFNVHAFKYYMGEELGEGKILNPFDGSKLHTDKAKILIMNAVNTKMDLLEALPSQWKPKPLGCLCKDKYAKMTHIDDPDNMNQYMANEKVKDFREDEDGKIYQVGGKYVRALEGGEKIEEVEQDEICYVLKDDIPPQIGEIKGISEMPDVESGAITVALDWEDSTVNLDLDVRWDAGEYDIQDIECPKEHWFIENKSSVTEGKREIWVNLKEMTQSDGNVSDTVVIDIKALGTTMPLVVDVNEEGEYDIGHVADIVIEYVDNKFVPRLEFVPKPNVQRGSRGGGGISPPRTVTCEEQYGEFNCECMPCSAKIIPYLEQALAGPLSGAAFKIYEAVNYASNTPLYTGTTSVGSDILTAGIIDVAKSLTNTLQDNTLYVIEARGGIDIDSDDDYIVDGIDVINRGSFRSLVLGKDLKKYGYKINILTEVSYQVVKNKIGTIADSDIRRELDDIATYLLSTPIYDGEITYADVIAWLPTYDKKNLFYAYDERFESVVQKIYKDQDIYEDAFALVYGSLSRPRLKGLYLKVSEEIENNIYVGSVEIVSEGNSSIHTFTLSGEQSTDFRIGLDGSIYVSDSADIDFEAKETYNLKATAVNADGNTTVSVNIEILDAYDAPVAKGYEGGILFSTAQSAEWVARVIFDSGKSPITDIELIGEEARYFDINISGDIVVSALGLPGITDNTKFHFKVIAENAYGQSLPAGITLHINAVKNTPSLHSFTARVNEHSPENTRIHTVSFESGSAPVDAFILSGEGSGNFSINTQGEVRISVNADLDYEKKSSYSLNLGARNLYGESENVQVHILLNDVLDTPVLKANQEFSVDENITSSLLIGNILKERGLSNVSDITLSNTLFRVDVEGNVYIAEGQSLDFETNEIHRVTATASNSYGSSLPVTFIVHVQDVVDVATLSPFTTTIVEHTTVIDSLGLVRYTQGTSEIVSFHLAGLGSEKFQVDKEGKVSASSGVEFDYEAFSRYDLKIRALNASGYSKPVDFVIVIQNILDAPEIQSLNWTIDENTKNVTLNGNIVLKEGLSPITKIIVRSAEGNISTDIAVGLEGKVHVLENADLDYEVSATRKYSVRAYNNEGFSNTVALTITLRNVLDAPEIEKFSGSIDENVAMGTVVGQLSINPGLSEVLEVSLFAPIGADYISPFSIDKNGTIRVKNKLDYETKAQYQLDAYAINQQGRSSISSVSIEIFDSVDGPILNAFYSHVSEGADNGYLIGSVTYENGLDPITSMALSGVGSENFTIDKEGIITLASDAQLDYETTAEYHFWAQAFSLGDTSNIVDINITVLDVNENARVGVGLWENASVKIYELQRDGNRTLIFEEVTSSSNEYNKSGLFDSHRLELETDKFYIYEASSGVEKDANQDGVLDDNVTEHNSTLYAVTKGSWVRQMNKPLSVTMMSDVCYRWIYDHLNSGDFESIDANLQAYYKPVVSKNLDNIDDNWKGNCRDALVYRPKTDQYAWSYRFDTNKRSFMKRLLLDSNYNYYQRYINNILSNNTVNIHRNDKSIIDDINLLRYDVRYVSFGEGGEYYIDIFDISDISDINSSVKISEMWLDYSNGNGVKVLSNSKERYLSIESNLVYSYNVEDPFTPLKSIIETGWSGELNKVLFSSDDDYLYMANGSAGFWVVDAHNFTIEDYIVYTESCVDLCKMSQDKIAVLVSRENNSSIEIFDISDSKSLNPLMSIDTNSAKATTFIFNGDKNKVFVGGEKEGVTYLNIYTFTDNTIVYTTSIIHGNYGKVIEIELKNGENEIMVTTEYYMLRYDISSIMKPILLEEVQL